MTFTPCPQTINIAEHTTQQELRRAIDLVATLRARVLRVGLFGTRVYRPDPTIPHDPTQHAQEIHTLRGEVELITKVISTLTNGTALLDIPKIVVDWVRSIGAQMPEALACIAQLDHLSRNVLSAAQRQSPQQGAALAEHLRVGRGGFSDAVTALCDALWKDLARQDREELHKATTAAKALNDRLARLERIGKHVRLVSLNASVEAARAGDVGKGLMVIAHEFKSLAEEIQTLAKDAGQDMAQIS
jgi:hypothetical protein